MANNRGRQSGNSAANVGLAVGAVIVIAMVGYVLTRSTDTAAVPSGLPTSATTTSSAPTKASIAAPTVPLLIEDDFTKAPDGKPTKAATGQTYSIVETGLNTSGMTVSGGLLRHGAPTARNGASYLEARLPGDVQRIGADAVFSKNSAFIALVVWQTSLAEARNKTAPGPIPRAGIHFVAGPHGWHLGIYTGKGEDILKTVNFPSALVADGQTAHTFEVTRKGDEAWVTAPDGTVTGPITDPRISDWAGRWPCWELYEFTPDMKPAAFAKIWAG